jgi:hypothetical protein
LFRGGFGHIETFEGEFAAMDGVEESGKMEEGRFSATTRSDKGDAFSLIKRKVEIFEYRERFG